MPRLTAMFLGTAAACLGIVAFGEHILFGNAQYFRLGAEVRAHSLELFILKDRVKHIERDIDRDRKRREEIAHPIDPTAPANIGSPQGDRIPAQTLPTTPKE